MDTLRTTIIQHIYEYGNTHQIKFAEVLKQLSAHCFIYNCHKRFKPWSNCYCYSLVCKTYVKYCHRILYDEISTHEYDLAIIIPLCV